MRRVAAAAVVVLVGCGAKPPEPLPAISEQRQPVAPPRSVALNIPMHIRVPRPAVDILDPRPDLGEEPRWPLTMMQHPTMEPAFNVARVLADPGISWTDLCASGAQRRHDPARHDELEYLSGWCAAENHDLKTAVTTLAPLRRSPVPEIANAVPLDLANMLVQSQDAEHADQLLTDLQVRDPRLWDLLAAAYFEIGKNDDSLHATTTAMQLDPAPSPATNCHRLARALLLGPDAVRAMLLEQLHGLAENPRVKDPTCVYLDLTVPCVLEHGCYRYYESQKMTAHDATFAALVDRWTLLRDWSGWLDYAWDIRHAFDANGAVELLHAALEGTVVAAGCDPQRMHAVEVAADAMETGRTIDVGPIATWVHTLVEHPDQCEAFVAQWLAANPQ
jgi:hypothetical protein